MGQRRGTADWRLIITTVALATLLGAGALFTGAARSVDGVLYQEVYPPDEPGPPIVDLDNYEESLERALGSTDTDTEFRRREDGERLADDDPLLENTPYIFVTTLTLAPSTGDPRQVRVARENNATLRSGRCAPECGFDISPETPQPQTLMGDGTRQWEWEVTPRETGSQRLILEIEPTVFVDGRREVLNKINTPIPIDVDVHPNRTIHTQVLAAAEDVELDIPNELTVDRPQDVTVRLPLPSGHEVVRVGLRLMAGQNSVPTSIVLEQQNTVDDTRVVRWTITPEAEGPLDLTLAVESETNAGDQPLDEEAKVQHVSRVLPRPPTFSEWVRDRALWLTTIVTVPIALLTLWNEVQKRRRRGGNGTPTDDTTPGSGP